MAQANLTKEEVVTGVNLTLSPKEAFFLLMLLGSTSVNGGKNESDHLVEGIYHELDFYVNRPKYENIGSGNGGVIDLDQSKIDFLGFELVDNF